MTSVTIVREFTRLEDSRVVHEVVVQSTPTQLVVTAPGPQGAPGRDGAGVANLSASFVQASPSGTWSVAHNMGYNPAGVTVQDHLGSTIEYDTLAYVDINNLVMTFSAEISGEVWLS